MKLPAIVFLLIITNFCFAQNNTCPIQLQPVGGITENTFQAENTINSNANILQNNNVDFLAGETILLNPGFSTGQGANFNASITDCNQPGLINAITWHNTPTAVSLGESYQIEINYELTQTGFIHLILADENWNKIGEVISPNLNAGSSIENLLLEVTGNPSANTNYLQARLLNTSWEEIGVSNILLTIPEGSPNELNNSINWTTIPESLSLGATYTVNIDYSLGESGIIYLLLMNENWENIGHVWTETPLSAGSGTAQLELPVTGSPSSGINYIQAQLLGSNWASLGVEPIQQEIGQGNSTGGSNSLDWENIPTSVTAGQTYDIEVAYTLAEAGVVYVQLMDNNWNKIDENFINLNPGSSIITLPLTLDRVSNINYLQAQLFDSQWNAIGVPMIQEPIEGNGNGNSTSNTLNWNNINNLPDNITAGSSYDVDINYSLTGPGLIYLQLMNANFEKVGEIWTNTLNAGVGTETLRLPVDSDANSSIFYLQAQLFDTNWMSIGVTPIQEEIDGNTNCPQFGRRRNDDPTTTVYYEDYTLTAGRPTQRPADVDLRYASPNDNLWTGYHTNWFIGAGWRGPIKANWGNIDIATGRGSDFWMEWENIQQPGSSHGELDIKVQKHLYSAEPGAFGYPTPVGALPDNLICTATGQWTPCSRGRGHINLTAWVSTENTLDDFDNIDSNDPTEEKVDIIIHGWDNSGNMSARDGWNIIGRPTSGGITYDILERDGDIGEKASYNIVPHINGLSMENRAPLLGDYPDTSPMSFNIDAKFFIDWLKNNATGDDGAPIFTDDWYLVGLEWTITPQSGDVVAGIPIPASKGGWTFSEYFIPNLNSSSLNEDAENVNIARSSQMSDSSNNIKSLSSNAASIFGSQMQGQVIISPNPFSNFITVTQKVISPSEETTLSLFDVTGQQLQSFSLKAINQQIPTSHLAKGLYFYQVTNARGEMMVNGKIVKP